LIYEKVLFVQNTVSKNMEKWPFFKVQKFHTYERNIIQWFQHFHKLNCIV